jgi:uroporphyrin-III C-methyltransferase
MPAAAVENATRPDARQLVTRLDALPSSMRAAGIGSPAILIVGRTVRVLRAELALQVHALP